MKQIEFGLPLDRQDDEAEGEAAPTSSTLSRRSPGALRTQDIAATAAASDALDRALSASEFAGEQLDVDIAAAWSVPCTPALAKTSAQRLMSFHPSRDLGNSDVFALALFELFMSYPASLVSRLVDPAHGIASELKFFPSIGDVSTWLKRVASELEAKKARYRPPAYIRRRAMTEDELTEYQMTAIPPPRIERLAPPPPPLRTTSREEIESLLAESEGEAVPRHLDTPWLRRVGR